MGPRHKRKAAGGWHAPCKEVGQPVPISQSLDDETALLKTMKHITPLIIVACAITTFASAQTPTPTASTPAGTDANNTARNAGDASRDVATADRQGNSESDLKLVQTIRKNVMASDALSFEAKNCKIIVLDGSVVLRGPVDSQKEKEVISSIAMDAAGQGKVTDALEVKMKGK